MISSNPVHHETQSLNELVSALTEGERTTFNQIFRSITIPMQDLEETFTWSNDSYTRNCIAENEQFELIILCWEKDQATPIHDHGGEECWVKIIKGEFDETIYKKDENGELSMVKSHVSSVGDTTYMIDFMGYHQLKNISNSRAVSLHLYAKPIRNCNIYDEEEKSFTRKDLSYDTISKLTAL